MNKELTKTGLRSLAEVTLGNTLADIIGDELTEFLAEEWRQRDPSDDEWEIKVRNKLPEHLDTELGKSEDEEGFWNSVTQFFAESRSDADLEQEKRTELKESEASEGLKLMFGHHGYSREGRLEESQLPRRNPTSHNISALDLLLDESLVPERDFSFRVEVSAEHEIVLEPGVTLVLALSNSGKTTLLRNLATATLNAGVPTAYLPWNEREYYSALGTRADLVGMIEDTVSQAKNVDHIDKWKSAQPVVALLDSVCGEVVASSGAAGKQGMNTAFFQQLTQWHHAFADRNVCMIVVGNPNNVDQEFLRQVTELSRGSVDGILTLDAPGRGHYEHVATGRTRKSINIDTDGFVLRDVTSKNTDRKEKTSVKKVVEFEDLGSQAEVDKDVHDFVQHYLK